MHACLHSWHVDDDLQAQMISIHPLCRRSTRTARSSRVCSTQLWRSLSSSTPSWRLWVVSSWVSEWGRWVSKGVTSTNLCLCMLIIYRTIYLCWSGIRGSVKKALRDSNQVSGSSSNSSSDEGGKKSSNTGDVHDGCWCLMMSSDVDDGYWCCWWWAVMLMMMSTDVDDGCWWWW